MENDLPRNRCVDCHPVVCDLSRGEGTMMLAPATLDYGYKNLTLDLHEESSVLDTGGAAEELHAGRTIYVRTQPGDGTCYRFVLFPAWGWPWTDFGGEGVGDGKDYLIVAPLHGKVYPIVRGANWHYIQEKLEWHEGNAHSARVMEAFLNRVWDGIAILRGEVTAL